jgi:hypothetical protein
MYHSRKPCGAPGGAISYFLQQSLQALPGYSSAVSDPPSDLPCSDELSACEWPLFLSYSTPKKPTSFYLDSFQANIPSYPISVTIIFAAGGRDILLLKNTSCI